MAGDAIVGALRVVLGMDTAAFEEGAKKASKETEQFGKNIGAAAAAITVAVTAMLGAIAVGVQRTLKEMDEFSKLSSKIGVPVETLSKLKLAAELSGVSVKELGEGMGKLGKAAAEAVGKPMSMAANAFKLLGINVKDSQGGLKSANDLMLEIAEAFTKIRDPAAKTAIAMALFGEAGVKLIPMLNQGRTGIQAMTEEAEKLGIVISTQTAKAAERFEQNLIRLAAAKDAVFIKLSAQLLPALERLSQRFVESAKDGGSLDSVVESFGKQFVALVQAIDTAVTFLGGFSNVWKALKDALKSPFDTASWEKLRDAVANTAVAARDAYSAYTPMAMAVQETATMLAEYTKIATAAGTATKDVNYQILFGKTAFDQFIDSTKKSTAALEADRQAVGALTGFRETMRVVMQAEEVAIANRIVLDEQQRAKLYEVAAAAGEAALKLQGTQLVFQNLEPLQAYQLQLELTRQAMEKVGATSDQIGRAQEKVAQQFGMAWQNIGASIAGTAGALSQLTGTFAKENKAMGIASKAFGIGQAVINTAIAVTKAFATLPPPASYAAAALAAATGAAQIATISMQNFATGGSFKVGGAGGIDSQLVQFRASPGEMVDVRKPGATGPSSEVILRGMRGRDLFTGEYLRDLVDGLNAAHSDGYRLKFAG